MLRNYLLVAWRNLLRHKGYSLINVAGLAIGIAFCILSFLFIRHEWSYDDFHSNGERIYRVYRQETTPEGSQLTVWQPVPLGPALVQAYPEMTKAVRFWSASPVTVRCRGELLKEEGLVLADPAVFEVFSFPRVAGQPRTALDDKHGLVITSEVAHRYFGGADPIGERLGIGGSGLDGDFTVTGVVDLPANSSIRFNLVVSSQYRLEGDDATKWNYYSAITYVVLAEGAQPLALEERFPSFVNEHLPVLYKEQYGDRAVRLRLQPLNAVHLAAGFQGGLAPASDPAYSYILAGISLAVLLIACVNFTNLSFGLAASRFKEVGVRRVLGSTRRQLVQQFCGEAALLSVVALCLGVALAEAALPGFGNLVDRKLTLGYDPAWAGLVGVVLAAGLLAGSYPALVLSRSQPNEVFKGHGRLGGGSWFGRGLIVVQFTLSTGLVILTLLMAEQMDFLRARNLGYADEQVLVVHEGYNVKPEERQRLLGAYQSAAAQNRGIADIAAASAAFDGGWAEFVTYSDEGWRLAFFRVRTDARLVAMLGMEMVQGRGFIEGSEKDLRESAIVNEALVRTLGWDDPIGRVIPGEGRTVIGVVKDFHLQSLHYEVKPVVIEYAGADRLSNVFVKVEPSAIPSVLKLLKDEWQEVFPYHPFEYSFLEQDVARQYRAEERWGRIVWCSAALAIFISCLGAFGLTALTLARRTKEIGIRKVLGASVPSVVGLLSKEFTYLVVAANLIAWPIAWYAMHRWLESFAYRIEMGPGVFVLGGLVALGIAWLTVSWQAIRAALANPVEALRYE
jgi:putative ABC transport system permease protein